MEGFVVWSKIALLLKDKQTLEMKSYHMSQSLGVFAFFGIFLEESSHYIMEPEFKIIRFLLTIKLICEQKIIHVICKFCFAK